MQLATDAESRMILCGMLDLCRIIFGIVVDLLRSRAALEAETSTMRRREFITLLGGGAAWPLTARAQQARRSVAHARIAFLGAESASTNQYFADAFRQGMREHGYIEGQNVTLVERWAEGRSERFPELIGELIRLNVNVIVAVSISAALAAKNGTTTIPPVLPDRLGISLGSPSSSVMSSAASGLNC
jgi:hypothetical protein